MTTPAWSRARRREHLLEQKLIHSHLVAEALTANTDVQVNDDHPTDTWTPRRRMSFANETQPA